ncbi:calcium/sodium antiporter [Rubritalea spongiae]|uniref:Calcium/sodium antiporter n=1 Tax=Rubritalea spongiae TaxID=430797 RepID=A0ABW5E5L7_9BACT
MDFLYTQFPSFADSLLFHLVLILIGLVALYYGAEWLVKGASEIAVRVGISPLVVGLTVVAFGTSAPELLVCLEANLGGRPDVALGNIIGSNICNIALILGVSAAMKPIVINRQIIRREMPILIVVTLAFIVMLYNGDIGRFEGGLLFAGVVIYVVVSIIQSRKEHKPNDFGEFSAEDVERVKKAGALTIFMDIGFILLGLAVLKFGSEWLVVGGDFTARRIGVDDSIIALFLFAFGTSLPELATSIVAVKRGEGDIITGNAVGSCIFNILAVIGITALVKPVAKGDILMVDQMVMLGATVAIFLFMWSRMRLSRMEGVCLLLAYVAYSVVRYNMT